MSEDHCTEFKRSWANDFTQERKQMERNLGSACGGIANNTARACFHAPPFSHATIVALKPGNCRIKTQTQSVSICLTPYCLPHGLSPTGVPPSCKQSWHLGLQPFALHPLDDPCAHVAFILKCSASEVSRRLECNYWYAGIAVWSARS